MKKFILGFVVILFFSGLASGEVLPKEYFIASRKSKIYHEHFCPDVKRIKKENILIILTPEEARSMNYRPCKDCQPPTESEK